MLRVLSIFYFDSMQTLEEFWKQEAKKISVVSNLWAGMGNNVPHVEGRLERLPK